MNSNFQPFGNNIWIRPESRNKIVGDTAKYYLYGDVLGIGEDVKSVRVGDQVGYVLWGLTEVEMADGTKQYFMQEHPDFIKGIKRAKIGQVPE